MIPIADNLNVIEKQNKLFKVLPDGIAIDLDALAEELSDGKNKRHNKLEYVAAKGSYLYRSSQINGEFNNAKNLQEIQTEIVLIS
jgi:hypothetical protein